jgi:hypothetical protein
MALEGAYPRLALRGKYALSISAISPDELPDVLRDYHSAGFQVELRALYENGGLSRRQWLFRDDSGVTRLVASFNSLGYTDPPGEATEAPGTAPAAAADPGDAGPAAGESPEAGETPPEDEAGEPEGPDMSGFIELYDAGGLIIEEHQIDSVGKDQITRYIYRDTLLVRAETRIKTPKTEEAEETTEDYWADHYRYSRSYSLRSVERVFYPAAVRVPSDERVRLAFPHMILGAARDPNFVSPGSAYGSDFFEDILMDSLARIIYTTDDRGRVLMETRRDEEGNVVGELWNTWSGDRLVRVEWKSGEDQRITEYEYDGDGDRIMERNINRGLLERTIRREGERDVEELYMNGRVILRAIWEGGRKISEVRVNPRSASPEDTAGPAGAAEEAP